MDPETDVRLHGHEKKSTCLLVSFVGGFITVLQPGIHLLNCLALFVQNTTDFTCKVTKGRSSQRYK